MQRDVEIVALSPQLQSSLPLYAARCRDCSTQSSYSRLYHWTQRDVEIVALSLVTVVSTTTQRDVEIVALSPQLQSSLPLYAARCRDCSTQSSYSRLYHCTQRDVEICSTQSSYSRLYHCTQRDVEIVALSLVTVVSTTVRRWM